MRRCFTGAPQSVKIDGQIDGQIDMPLSNRGEARSPHPKSPDPNPRVLAGSPASGEGVLPRNLTINLTINLTSLTITPGAPQRRYALQRSKQRLVSASEASGTNPSSACREALRAFASGERALPGDLTINLNINLTMKLTITFTISLTIKRTRRPS